MYLKNICFKNCQETGSINDERAVENYKYLLFTIQYILLIMEYFFTIKFIGIIFIHQ